VGGGKETHLDPAIVSPYETLERGTRSRRGRDFLRPSANTNTAGKHNNNNTNTTTANAAAAAGKPVRRRGRDAFATKASAAVGMGKENRRPPKPAKSSSKRKQRPPKVTPIPKTIVIDEQTADEVSPMWMMEPSKPSESSLATNQKAPSPSRVLNFGAASRAPHSSQPPPPHKSSCGTPRILPSSSSGKTESMNTTKKRKRPEASHENSTTILSKKRPPKVSLTPNQTRKIKAHHPAAHKPITSTTQKPPTKASFSRTTSAYDTNTSKPRAKKQLVATKKEKKKIKEHRKPLLDVYRSEVEKARKFMDEMVSGPRIEHSNNNSSSNSRYQEFLSHLYKVWIKVDDEEEISEDRFKAVFQKVTGGSLFTSFEVDTHLSALCEQGDEVMRSDDGMLYRIR
jgi:hypothetical protein